MGGSSSNNGHRMFWRYVGDFLSKDGGLVLRMKTEVDLP